MPAPRDPSALLAAARLYYLQGCSQAEVAERLGTSRSNVSRMLTEAQRTGIVEIRINDPAGRVRELEDELAGAFRLHDVRVASRSLGGATGMEEQVGDQACQLFLDELKDGSTVAISWGQALQAMVYATTTDRDYGSVTVVPLVGGLSSVRSEISGQELVRELAVRLGASYRSLLAPASLESRASRDALLSEPSIKETLAAARRADLAFVGIGTPDRGSSAALLESIRLEGEAQRQFWAAGPVGDIAARFYDASGRPIHGPVEDRVLAVTLEELTAVPNVVGVAYGRGKTLGVLGAIRGRLIDSLVCDETLARSLLNETRTAGEIGGD